MMEYFSSGVTDNFSLQEMIESDINTDFGDHLMNGTSSDMDVFNCIPEPIFTIPTEPEASMESTELGAASAMDTDSADKLTNGDLNWLQTVSLSALKPENSDPNLLVNPQTGLPTLESSSTDQLLSASGAQDVPIITSLASVQPQVIQIQSQISPVSASPPSPMSPVAQTVVKTEHTKAGTISLALSTQPVQVIQNTQNRPLVTVQSPTATSLTSQLLSGGANKLKGARMDTGRSISKVFPKPVYSYSCLIAMALKNCDSGALPVSEIYSFMTENFPYFKTAPDGWKNSVRHNLSLNKCFEKIDNPRSTGNSRKGCLWGLNPDKIDKMDDEIAKWRKKDPIAIKRSMAKPESLEMLEKGIIGSHSQRHVKASSLPSGVVRSQAGTTVRLVPIQVNSPQVVSHQAIPAGAQSSDDVRVSMVEITPQATPDRVVVKKEPIKQEEGLNRDDLDIIDTALNLDPSLNELQLQQNLWEELASDMMNYDDLPLVTSSAGLNTSALSTSAQAAWSGVVLGHTGTPGKNIASISRTISAQT